MWIEFWWAPGIGEDGSDHRCQQWGQLKYNVGYIDFLKSLSKAYDHSLGYLYHARYCFNVCRKIYMDVTAVPVDEMYGRK